MPKLLTANQFVTGLLCSLRLRGVSQLKLVGSDTDAAFAKAYDNLLAHRRELDVIPDFTLAPNPYHGDSETLRETLYAARQKGIVSINNPSFKTVEIELDEEEASDFLSRSPLPRDYFSDMVEKYFAHRDMIGEARDPHPQPIA
jgi:hypothetical protein